MYIYIYISQVLHRYCSCKAFLEAASACSELQRGDVMVGVCIFMYKYIYKYIYL